MVEVSAVVPTYNNEDTIGKCLESLVLNNLDEILVIDGGSRDRTLELASQFPRVRTVSTDRGIARGRDIGWRSSEGQFILFLDADAYIRSGAVEVLRTHLSRPEIAGVSCRVACANCEKILPRLRDFDFTLAYAEQFKDREVADCIADPTLCGLFQRRALEDIDGFDLTYSYAEDMKLLLKMKSKGHRVLMVRNPAVFHHHRENLPGLCMQFYHHGLGRRLLVQEEHGKFYRQKDFGQFLNLFLRNAPKAGLEVVLCYPFYRLFTETAFLLGYVLEGS